MTSTLNIDATLSLIFDCKPSEAAALAEQSEARSADRAISWLVARNYLDMESVADDQGLCRYANGDTRHVPGVAAQMRKRGIEGTFVVFSANGGATASVSVIVNGRYFPADGTERRASSVWRVTRAKMPT